MDNAEYVVTDQAPPLVEGRRVKVGDRINLTAAAAAYHLRAGHVRRAEEASPPAEADAGAETAEAPKRRGK